VTDAVAPVAPHRWFVVGAGGLLGGAVSAQLSRRPGSLVVRAAVPWHDEDASVAALTEQFRPVVGRGATWSLVWCAGAGVVASGLDALDRERRVIQRFLEASAAELDEEAAARGSAFVASSAGGVYAGSTGAPFHEGTEPLPLAPYGWSKLGVEQLFRTWAGTTGVPVVVGRFANIYGPGQDLAKAQGLVSQLCLAHLQGRPSSIYVPVDTIRDYLFVDDAAALTVAALDRAATLPAGTVVTKIMASGLGVTIGALIAELQRVVKRRPRIVWGSHASSSRQALDLRFRSRVWPDLDQRMLTPIAAGIHRTLLSLHQGGRPR
jgi:UDP-glucose 4-epimerase